MPSLATAEGACHAAWGALMRPRTLGERRAEAKVSPRELPDELKYKNYKHEHQHACTLYASSQADPSTERISIESK